MRPPALRPGEGFVYLFSVKPVNKPCTKCGKPRDRGHCLACHNAYNRDNRPTYAELPEEEKIRSRCRAYTNVMVKRGKLQKTPCEGCGSEKVQAHHHDYTKPMEVQWLCRRCRHPSNSQKKTEKGMSLNDVLTKWLPRLE